MEISNIYDNERELNFFTDSAIKHNGYKIIEKGDWTMIYYIGGVSFDYPLVDIHDEPEKCEDELLYEKTKNEFNIKEWDYDSGNTRYRTQYNFLICAYNDKEQKIRYIASACCGHANRKGGPYYLTLDW